MQEASARTYQGEYSRGQAPLGIFSFCVGRLGRERPTVWRLTESGAQPPTLLAVLLLLALPLLLALQKAAAEPE
jgi:hypothetical protein